MIISSKHLVVLVWMTTYACALAQELNLSKNWYFNLGDRSQYAYESIQSKGWKPLSKGLYIENNGFPEFTGYAWLRNEFEIPASWADSLRKISVAYLFLSKIDDCEEIFLNRVKIGSYGSFPAAYASAYDEFRVYRIETQYLKPGEINSQAVRLYDERGNGGISSQFPLMLVLPQAHTPLPYAKDELIYSWKHPISDSMMQKINQFGLARLGTATPAWTSCTINGTALVKSSNEDYHILIPSSLLQPTNTIYLQYTGWSKKEDRYFPKSTLEAVDTPLEMLQADVYYQESGGQHKSHLQILNRSSIDQAFDIELIASKDGFLPVKSWSLGTIKLKSRSEWNAKIKTDKLGSGYLEWYLKITAAQSKTTYFTFIKGHKIPGQK